MKKLLFIALLVVFACEDEQDTTPPTVSIQSPITNQSINEIVTIVVETNDNEGINRVEFYIDDSLFFTDTESPYEYEWNTTQYEDNSEHIVKVISYDNSDNSTTSQPIVYVIDNSTSTPNGGNITSVTYTLTEMMVEWEESTDGDFKDYKVLYSETGNGDRDTLETYTDISTTSHTITEFDPLIENWFWVQVTDTLGLSSIGTGMTNYIDSFPTQSELYSIVYENGSFIITWSQNNDDDFQSYTLYESQSEDMSGQTEIFYTNNNTETSYTVTGVSEDEIRYYQIVVEDIWGLETVSDIEVIIVNTVTSVSGKVLNAVDQSPMANVLVTIFGQTGTTNTDGNYTILNVGTGNHNVAGASDGFCPFSAPLTIPDGYEDEFFTYNFAMSPILEGEQIRMVLNWGATPNDLDSHLLTPEIEGNTHHIYYANRGSYTAVPYAKLDTDVTQGYGPETITINQLFAGTYTYYIKNYSGGSSGLKNSDAVVQIYSGEPCTATIIEVPTDTNGLFWYVCDIDGATGDITVVNQIQSSAP